MCACVRLCTCACFCVYAFVCGKGGVEVSCVMLYWGCCGKSKFPDSPVLGSLEDMNEARLIP